ncbi:cytochrome b/b6 domain-containing protein [Methyloligella sp. 2.7D]|uniref:cytochrome b/b6 domain-containing protein n=1 Tax=unclassified Methyloligella TaxID=2625955 RepID=UPI00157CC30A|nr:cytochrome b/b6 domain-containing protein [Methyloligella sp. GL2]QKP76025.1 cytochrome b/b6 domain-containing protein [Methyloligella sp. GL2]
MSGERSDWIYVWDPFVRIFHWVLFIAFTVSYLTGDEVMGVHVWSGYLICLLLITRIIWGFVGPEHARFSSFIYRPSAVFSYLGDLLRFRGKRYLGHSPAGGAMVIALLLSLTITVTSGLLNLGANDNAGPLGSFFPEVVHEEPAGHTHDEAATDGAAAHDEAAAGEEEGHVHTPFGDAAHEVHEIFANITLALVILHVLGVILASIAHREHLPRSMVTGYKRP